MIRYAAIDIGSNAVRLLIADVIHKDDRYTYKKNTLVRVPLRLGDDAFLDNVISEKKSAALYKTMRAFRDLMDVYQVTDYLACATSAMREASNGPALAAAIREQTGLNLEIVAGAREARIIYANHIEAQLDIDKNFLYIDVGGGSTEISLFVDKKLVASRSFNIGTIRILDNQDKEEHWDEMHDWVRLQTKQQKQLVAIGTGGNINKLFRMSEEKENMPISFAKLNSLYNKINGLSLKERISLLGLNQDRADVIVPAAEIYLTLLKWTGIRQIYVPRVGLADGMINLMIEENLQA
ncbi:exopolyphosphatase [Pedobacter yulinensis]|uniref:Exopolyphosphatase n=1 Tax=Pedobacter yulinensis TaxID=2126353 RepID=A0A2T3HI21_9SPHI|nr:exopolyphosphatase [Pedobacter yulinensis]PST82095.1 exopolyphosphatase [Pedobacter yulinensis]